MSRFRFTSSSTDKSGDTSTACGRGTGRLEAGKVIDSPVMNIMQQPLRRAGFRLWVLPYQSLCLELTTGNDGLLLLPAPALTSARSVR